MKFEILKNGQSMEIKDLSEGQYKIGRSPECDICLNSPKVSKNHALLIIKGDKAAIVDSGSANGIFINGILVKKQKIDRKDVLNIGDFEIRILHPLSKGRSGYSVPLADGNAALNISEDIAEPAAVADSIRSPQEKVLYIVDQKVLSPFYQLMQGNDWRLLLAGIIISTLVLSVLLSVFPIVRWSQAITTKESLERAHAVLSQVVRENYRILAKTNDTTRLTTEVAEKSEGFVRAYVVDANTKTILAPAKYYNNTLDNVYYQLTLKKVLEEKVEKAITERSQGTYLIAQPVPAVGNENLDERVGIGPAAVVIAEFDIPSSITAIFEPLLEAVLFATLLSLGAFYLISKMMSYPIIKLSEQLDSALKGEDVNIYCPAKFKDLENLATSMNFAVTRMKQGRGGEASPLVGEDQDAEDAIYAQSVQEFDEASGDALLLLTREKRISFVGHLLEELVGMRNQTARGQNISDACRDPGFAGTCVDLAERVIGSLGATQTADVDINGIRRSITAIGHKSANGEIRFVFLTVKMGGGE